MLYLRSRRDNVAICWQAELAQLHYAQGAHRLSRGYIKGFFDEGAHQQGFPVATIGRCCAVDGVSSMYMGMLAVANCLWGELRHRTAVEWTRLPMPIFQPEWLPR